MNHDIGNVGGILRKVNIDSIKWEIFLIDLLAANNAINADLLTLKLNEHSFWLIAKCQYQPSILVIKNEIKITFFVLNK